MKVDFKFELDQKVKAEKLGVTGLVSMCAIDNGGKIYYVKTVHGAEWYSEKLLTSAE